MPIGMVPNTSGNKRNRPSADGPAAGAETGQRRRQAVPKSAPSSAAASDMQTGAQPGTQSGAQRTRRQPQSQWQHSQPQSEARQSEDLYDDSVPDDYSEMYEQDDGKRKAFIVISVLVVILVALVVARFFMRRGDDGSTDVVQQGQTDETGEQGGDMPFERDDLEDGTIFDEDGTPIYNEDGEVIDKDAINPGITDYDTDQSKTTAKVFSDEDFIKDLNGIDVSAVYNVASRDYVYDYVVYEAKRAIIDEGMELYWLDVMYNNKKYRIQVPFLYFKDLKVSGICKVQVEVLTLEGGGKIISWMQVVEDSAGVE